VPSELLIGFAVQVRHPLHKHRVQHVKSNVLPRRRRKQVADQIAVVLLHSLEQWLVSRPPSDRRRDRDRALEFRETPGREGVREKESNMSANGNGRGKKKKKKHKREATHISFPVTCLCAFNVTASSCTVLVSRSIFVL
jgi:hypothetical protein